MLFIDSKDNNTFKKLKKYRSKKYRDQDKKFLAEGTKFLDFDEVPEIIVLNEEASRNQDILARMMKFTEAKVIILSDTLFKDLTSQGHSQGVILVYPYKENQLENVGDNIIVLDRVADPGNLGTIIRTVDAAGFSDIVLVKGSVDAYNEKVIRSTMGSIFNVNLYYVEEQDLISFLKEREYKMIATTLHKDSIPFTGMTLKSKNAIIFGNEGSGVSENLIEKSEEKVIIPIYGTAESLNVAMACGIMVYKLREILDR